MFSGAFFPAANFGSTFDILEFIEFAKLVNIHDFKKTTVLYKYNQAHFQYSVSCLSPA